MRFGTFVDRLDAAVSSVVAPPVALAREETPATAMWIRPPFRVGVTRTAEGVRAWIGLRGVVGRQWNEPCEDGSIERLAIGFAAILAAPLDEPPDDDGPG
ncbi:MAG: hypothetical protein QOI11_1145 [Candidatus Eremiobacteraeota bacterium]|nr:hypothetical protein [Candidatus Eremiobacteraeota bacterium]